MADCEHCGATVPLTKSLSGRALDKQDRDCPNCGQPLGPEADRSAIRK